MIYCVVKISLTTDTGNDIHTSEMLWTGDHILSVSLHPASLERYSMLDNTFIHIDYGLTLLHQVNILICSILPLEFRSWIIMELVNLLDFTIWVVKHLLEVLTYHCLSKVKLTFNFHTSHYIRGLYWKCRALNKLRYILSSSLMDLGKLGSWLIWSECWCNIIGTLLLNGTQPRIVYLQTLCNNSEGKLLILN